MKVRSTIAVLWLALGLAGAAFAQDQPPAGPAGQPSQAEMEAMMKLISPGENHKHLGRLVGDWTYTIKMWMAPGAPPQETTGTMHADWILDGRYVQAVYKGTFQGMEFEGRATEGYDNIAKQYVSSWVDNMGTGIMQSTGKCMDEACKTMTMSGESMDPMSGQPLTMKSVTTYMDDGSFKMEMFMVAGGQETKMMELVAKKKDKM